MRKTLLEKGSDRSADRPIFPSPLSGDFLVSDLIDEEMGARLKTRVPRGSSFSRRMRGRGGSFVDDSWDPSHKNLHRSTFAAAVRAFGGPRWPLTGGAPIGGRVRSLREGVTPVSAPRDRPDRGFASGARTSRPPPQRKKFYIFSSEKKRERERGRIGKRGRLSCPFGAPETISSSTHGWW